MTATAESVRSVHAFLEGVDWELLEESAQASDAAIRWVREHPWALIAAGCALAAYGVYERYRGRRIHRVDVNGLVAP